MFKLFHILKNCILIVIVTFLARSHKFGRQAQATYDDDDDDGQGYCGEYDAGGYNYSDNEEDSEDDDEDDEESEESSEEDEKEHK